MWGPVCVRATILLASTMWVHGLIRMQTGRLVLRISSEQIAPIIISRLSVVRLFWQGPSSAESTLNTMMGILIYDPLCESMFIYFNLDIYAA